MKCKNCKSRDLVKDYVHAELYCKRCGLIHECPPIHCNGKPAVKYCFR